MTRNQQLRSQKNLQAQATLNFIDAAFFVKNVTAHHWIEVNKKTLILFQIKRQQNWINLIIVNNILLVFPLRSAYHNLKHKNVESSIF